MSHHPSSELISRGAARCGRCAEILPDETLTYCPSCGVPFSRVPPTDTYIRFEERHFNLARQSRRLQAWLTASALVACLAILASFWEAWSAGWNVAALQAQRTLIIHIHDEPAYPRLDRAVKREAVNIALQAFQDHFGIALRDYRVIDDDLPEAIAPYFRSPDLTRFSFWETKIFPKAQELWARDPQGPLHAVLTNVPIAVDGASGNDIETRHLSSSKLISGLGHPSLVVVSTFRMLTELPQYRSSRFDVRSPVEQARHVGEYLLAHELGHALIGLTDFVIDGPARLAARRSEGGRAPATEGLDESQCLMHTDEAGGFQAWEHIRRRTLGQPSTCVAYGAAIAAHRLRTESIALLKLGHPREAAERHRLAIVEARQNLLPWVAETWDYEHDCFLSVVERWMKRYLVFQSKDD